MKLLIIILCLAWYIFSAVKKSIKAKKKDSKTFDPSEDSTFSSEDSDKDIFDNKDIYSEEDTEDEYVYDEEDEEDEEDVDDETSDTEEVKPVEKPVEKPAAKSVEKPVAKSAVSFNCSENGKAPYTAAAFYAGASTDKKSGVVKAYNVDVEDDASADFDINTDVVDENIKSALDFSDVDKARAAFVASEIFNRKYN